jgi:hypothetical protein
VEATPSEINETLIAPLPALETVGVAKSTAPAVIAADAADWVDTGV